MMINEQYDWAKANAVVLDKLNASQLDLTDLPIQVDIPFIDQLPNEEYALLRKNGFGCSDSSILTNVNPYKTKEDLIAEKCRTYLTDEEKAIGEQSAVKKGRDLEPFIIQKYSQMIQKRIIKPTDMYRHKTFPFLTVNFDGVMIIPDESNNPIYIPDEIKVCTVYGAKHYDRTKAFFRETCGYRNIEDTHLADMNASIIEKAARYGIPPYYYTQLQMEMFHLDAPYGYLTVLFEKEWEICTWMVWKDEKTQHEVIIEGMKAWDKVASVKHLTFNEQGLINNTQELDEQPAEPEPQEEIVEENL